MRAAVLLLAALAALPAIAQEHMGQEHWVETWTAAQQQPRAETPAPELSNKTVRMVVRTSIGGRRLRLQFSNAYGTTPLAIAGAHVAIRSTGSSIVPSSDRELMVNGKRSFKIPPGALMITDPVDLEFPKLTDLAVSVYVPGAFVPQTQHSLALHTTYIGDGNAAGQQMISEIKTVQNWYWLSAIEVMAPLNVSAVVAFGDSITDGFHSTPDTNRMWPAVLAQRILSKPGAPQMAVVNEAISGNQILADRLV